MTQQAVAVCMAVGGDAAPRARTLTSLRAHTTDDVPILEIEPGTDPFERTPADDVVLVQPGCVVFDGWLEALRVAAYTSATVATATALTQHDLGDLTDGNALARAADAVRSGSLRLRPRLSPVARFGPCVYVRRSALDLVGTGDHFWRRCVERGLAHALADDVLVVDPRQDSGTSHEPSEPLARAVGAARRALHGLSVIIDARILEGATTGTHLHALELVAALARTEGVRLTAIIPDQPNEEARARLQALPRLSLVTYDTATGNADIVHRPFQLSNAGDLTFLKSLGERLVLTQQDLIAFHNPAYFRTDQAWASYRQLTRQSMAVVDRVVFFSAHARDDALAEDLVEPAHTSVVNLGVDHQLVPARGTAATKPPAQARRLLAEDSPLILCLGTDYQHKNRLFALRLFERLTVGHGLKAVLVFAGLNVPHGSSRKQEACFLSAHPNLGPSVLEVGAVSESEKEWLFTRSSLVVYPSVVEGFGFLPFEAAAHGVPCLWAAGSSLSELLPHDAAGIVPWDAEQTALRALELIRDEDARARNLQAIDRAAVGLTWDATAAQLLEVYRATANAPAKPDHSGDFALSEDAARLVGPGGELPEDVQRPLLALATHPRIARPVFGALKLGYRASYRLRRAQRRR